MQGPSCGFRERFFWSDRSGSTIFVGLGSAYAIETEETDGRFHYVEQQRQRWVEQIERHGEADMPPLLFGGFAFDPHQPRTSVWRGFPAGKLIAPTVLLSVKNGRTLLTVTLPTDGVERDMERIGRLFRRIEELQPVSATLPALVSDEEEEKERWLAAVRQAIASIRAGRLDKVVLARSRRLAFTGTIDAAAVLARLREQQPFAYLLRLNKMAAVLLAPRLSSSFKKKERCANRCAWRDPCAAEAALEKMNSLAPGCRLIRKTVRNINSLCT